MHIDLENEAFMTGLFCPAKAAGTAATEPSFPEVREPVNPRTRHTPAHMTGWNIEAATDHFRAGSRSGTLWNLLTG
ncbi:MAG: hypothetical protein KDI75_04450 [Xanthomonadales bacterium]|nr:hypothetical protein [Xanthomonadales bacterium]